MMAEEKNERVPVSISMKHAAFVMYWDSVFADMISCIRSRSDSKLLIQVTTRKMGSDETNKVMKKDLC